MPYRGDLLDQSELCYVTDLIMDCPFISITSIKAKLNSFVQSFNKYLLRAYHRVMMKIWWWAEEDLVPATWGAIFIQQSPSKYKIKTEERVTIERNMVPQEHIVGVWAGQWMTVINQVTWGYRGGKQKSFPAEGMAREKYQWPEGACLLWFLFLWAHIHNLPRNNDQKMSERKIQHRNQKFAWLNIYRPDTIQGND